MNVVSLVRHLSSRMTSLSTSEFTLDRRLVSVARVTLSLAGISIRDLSDSSS